MGMLSQGDQNLLKLLVKLSLMTESQMALVEKPTSNSDLSPIAKLAALAVFEENDAITLVAQKLGIKAIEINKQNVATFAAFFEPELISKVPLAKWSFFKAIPVGKQHNRLLVAMANPLDQESKNMIDFALGEPVQTAIAKEEWIKSVLAKREVLESHASNEPLLEEVQMMRAEEDRRDKNEAAINTSDLNTAPVIRLVNKIMLNSIERNASDIHISPEQDQVRVRTRVDGILQDLMTIPSAYARPVTSRIKLMAGMNIAEHRKPQDGRLRIKTGTTEKDLRVSTLPTMHGENIVARVLSADLANVNLEKLGMPEEMRAKFEHLLKGSSRVVLVTGPTGSGKTSTLYAGISLLNDGHNHIITVEDPIEYRVKRVNQIQVNPKVGLTFADGVRSILRQDPDVVVIGEIRDGETASIALQVAQTGHLVLSSLHTNSAPAAVTRLKDLGVPTYLIASSLQAILAQRLVRRLCSKCAVELSQTEKDRLVALGIPYEKARSSKGCDECGGIGFSGRVGVYSLLELDDKIREVVRTDGGEQELLKVAHTNGFCTLEEAAIPLIIEGTTSLSEAERVLGPLSPQKEAPTFAQVQEKTSPQTERTLNLRRRSVLLIEDDENTRLILAMILEQERYQVVQASSGAEAIESLQNQLPDIIVCDLMMPHMSGTEVIALVRSHKETHHLPVLMLTAADTEENELSGLVSGADDFVSKTADKRVLLSRINRLLARSSQ